MELSNLNIKNGLCISLGANFDSKFGSPFDSLLICKPKIEELINEWGDSFNEKKEEKSKFHTNFFWSSIYETLPHGVENEQPNYLNTLLLMVSFSSIDSLSNTSMGGSKVCKPLANTDLPVPLPPAIITPPKLGSTAAKSKDNFNKL